MVHGGNPDFRIPKSEGSKRGGNPKEARKPKSEARCWRRLFISGFGLSSHFGFRTPKSRCPAVKTTTSDMLRRSRKPRVILSGQCALGFLKVWPMLFRVLAAVAVRLRVAAA